jgi:sortase A
MMRRIVAAIGRSFISVGVLLLLFVAYQLWGTGIAYSKAQDKAKKEFEQRQSANGSTGGGSIEEQFSAANLGAAPVPTDPPVDTTTPVPTSTTAPLVMTTPLATTRTAPAPPIVADVPVAPVAPTTTATTLLPSATVSTLPHVRAGRSKMKRVPAGKVLGRLVIPRIKKDLGFVEGAGVEDLKGGPGHYAKTPLPGSVGNVGIACHRTTYGAPCFNLHLLQPGDPIFFETDYGKFRYEVVWHTIVSPKDKRVLAPTPGESVLTITTCNPQYSAAQRYVVRARLVGTAVDTDLYFEPEPVETIPPKPVPAVAVTSVDAEPGSIPLTGDSLDENPAVDENPTLDTSVASVASDSTVDEPSTTSADQNSMQAEKTGTGKIITFGWLSGRQSYWTSTLLWTLLCAGIWLVAWLLARGRRFAGQAVIYGLGFMILFLPALFFCFENLAHLLPENV